MPLSVVIGWFMMGEVGLLIGIPVGMAVTFLAHMGVWRTEGPLVSPPPSEQPGPSAYKVRCAGVLGSSVSRKAALIGSVLGGVCGMVAVWIASRNLSALPYGLVLGLIVGFSAWVYTWRMDKRDREEWERAQRDRRDR